MSAARPDVVGPPDGPAPPFPLRMEGSVIAGFGRGSKEVRARRPPPAPRVPPRPLTPSPLAQLGIPTANLPVDAALTPWIADARSGVYFGYAGLALPAAHPDRRPDGAAPPAAGADDDHGPPRRAVYPMVMSIGYNPFYKNTVRSAEVHLLHRFAADFYGAHMRLLILGFIREEQDYTSLDALVRDINTDCAVARNSLARDAWAPPRPDAAAAAWLLAPLP